MARKKTDMKCPYCDEVKAVSGMTSHVRHKHPENYKEFQANRAALVEKHKIVEGKPAPVVTEKATPAPEPKQNTDVDVNLKGGENIPPDNKPAPKEQLSGSFLGSIGKALRDW